jgi:hypothetical protein
MPYIKKFRKNFKIDKRANLIDSAVAIESCGKADEILNDYLVLVVPKSNEDGFRVRSLTNLTARLYEHVQGMLVAISTGSPASAEALARVVVEGAINIIYLAEKGDSGALIRFFRSWLSEHGRKLDEWKAKVDQEAGLDNDNTSALIHERVRVVGLLKEFVDNIEVQCSINLEGCESEWPKSLYKRFEALGREEDYYSSYHRLSGASHITGEDTIMWFLMMQAPRELAIKCAEEAWGYSIMMTRIAGVFFLDAAIACVEAYGRKSNSDLHQCRRELTNSVHEISRRAGVPVI